MHSRLQRDKTQACANALSHSNWSRSLRWFEKSKGQRLNDVMHEHYVNLSVTMLPAPTNSLVYSTARYKFYLLTSILIGQQKKDLFKDIKDINLVQLHAWVGPPSRRF